MALTSVVSMQLLNKKVRESTVVYKAFTDTSQGSLDNNSELIDNNVYQALEKTDKAKEDGVSLCLLGETMMGGEVTQNLEYIYSQAFKDIFSITKRADFTYTNFSTNITNFGKIENPKSKYLVTKEAVNGLTALGVDSVSIASDHIIDYPSDIVKNTISILETNDIFVAGMEDMPVYFEKGDKKIAIISTNSVIIGTMKAYKDNKISVYSYNNLKKNIEEAKHNADYIIVDVHWGRDHTYGLTDQMRNIATSAIDFGADLVVGTHALGVYPVVKYKEKPIIYSLGSLISDTEYNVGKEGFIFNINLDENAKINNIEMIPTFIENSKFVRLYNGYNEEYCNIYLEQFNNWHLQNGLNSSISNNKIILEF